MSILFDNRAAFRVKGYDRKGKYIGDAYVRSSDRVRAAAWGKRWLRILGRKPLTVSAEIYNPLQDPAMRGFVREIPAEES